MMARLTEQVNAAGTTVARQDKTGDTLAERTMKKILASNNEDKAVDKTLLGMNP